MARRAAAHRRRVGGAARGGDDRPWPWGDTFDAARCNCAEAGWGWTVPVARAPRRAPSPCGAEQLAGNVWEWVSDRARDGWGVVRGGCYLDTGSTACAPARELPADPARATATTGFRIVIDDEEERDGPGAVLIDALRGVYDPCCADRGVSIVDMGVVEDVRLVGGARRGRPDPDHRLVPVRGQHVGRDPRGADALDGRRDRRRQGRLGARLDAGPAVGVGPREARRCRSRSSSPTASRRSAA